MDHGDMVVMNASVRSKCGTGSARALRSAGLIPAVVYGGDRDPVSISLSHGDFLKQCRMFSIYSRIIELHIADSKPGKEYVVVKSVQKHPVSGGVLHVDFQFVEPSAEVKIEVPIVFLNEQKCAGVKRGGVLNVLHRSLTVMCSPHNIPKPLEVDLIDLSIGHSLHVSDLTLPKEIKRVAMNEDNPVIVTLSGASSSSGGEVEESSTSDAPAQ